MRAAWRGWRPRMRRAEATDRICGCGRERGAWHPALGAKHGPIVSPAAQFRDLPAEVGLRLLGRAVAHAGDEGPVELGKLEELYEALRHVSARRCAARSPAR